MKHIHITNNLRERLAAVERALATYTPGGDPSSVVDAPKVALADAVLEAVAGQRARLDAVPRPAAVRVIRPKRRRTA